jgi:ribonuclease P/MRP protein subunit RPP40
LSCIPQGSVLGPLFFVIFINDLPEFCGGDSDIFLFADDAKIMKHVTRTEDCSQLQNSCDKLLEWSNTWLLKLNIKKCMLLRLSTGDLKYDSKYILNNSGNPEELKEVNNMKDLGVIIDNKLSFKEHVAEKTHKAYSMIGIIRRNFKYVDKEAFIMLYKSMVRSHLEYANSVWNPHRIGQKLELEKVQKRATKSFLECKNMSYEESLQNFNLPTLAYHRNRGDMIEVYKILTKKYDTEVSVLLERDVDRRTRGNSKKLKVLRRRHDIRKYSFTVRIVNLWNGLPEEVISAESVNTFKNRLDKLWATQEIKYNWKAKLTGAGIRSLEF